MADERKIIGWFYRNGKRIPITEKKASKTERDLESITHNGQKIQKGSIIDIPGGTGEVERIYETSNPKLFYKNRVRVRDTKTNVVSDFASGRDLNPNFGNKTKAERLARKKRAPKGKDISDATRAMDNARRYNEEASRIFGDPFDKKRRSAGNPKGAAFYRQQGIEKVR